MHTSTDPRDIFYKLRHDFDSIEQFNDLVRESALYYQKYGSLDYLKIFIPNSNKNENGYSYRNPWTPEKAEEGANSIIHVFTKVMKLESYLKETKEDGVYLAFPTTSSMFLSFARYIGMASYIISEGRKKGIHITADKWLRDFPYKFHAAWYNRESASKEISAKLWQAQSNSTFAITLYDGQQNWLEREKYLKIENWNPTGEFIVVNVWEWKKTEEQNQKILEEFKQQYN